MAKKPVPVQVPGKKNAKKAGSKKAPPRRTLVAQNKKARHDYLIEDTYECGLVLTGPEVKSLRLGRASLVDGYATVDQGEVWLRGVHIPEYTEATWNNHAPRRPRKLLLHRLEILRLQNKLNDTGTTLVPLSLYFNEGGRAKVEIALARGKKLYDKRQTLIEKQSRREAERAMSAAVRRAHR
jgi:SsrA-binding protein